MKSASLANQLARVERRTISALLHTPPPLLLAGLGCAALAPSSDVANTFDAPRRGGPLPALLLFLPLALAFALFFLALRPPPPSLPPRRSWLPRLLFPPAPSSSICRRCGRACRASPLSRSYCSWPSSPPSSSRRPRAGGCLWRCCCWRRRMARAR